MPLYDYQCQQCTNGFTELRRSSEMDTQIDCPECGSRETIRSISWRISVANSFRLSTIKKPIQLSKLLNGLVGPYKSA